MNLTKSYEYFNPDELFEKIHIIGVGAVGSNVAENLCRHGVKEIHLWDFDTVSAKNIANQMFFDEQIDMLKTTAIEQTLMNINRDIKIIKHGKYTDEKLSGYVFMCPDSILVRKNIINSNIINISVKAFFDGRMRLTDAQHYACSSGKQKQLLETMAFTDEEASADTPRSACGETLSLSSTVKMLATVMVANFVNFTLTGKLNKTTFINLLAPNIVEAFPE